MGHQIGGELDEQAVMLDEFGTEIENAESKLDATMRKMAKVLNMSNGEDASKRFSLTLYFCIGSQIRLLPSNICG